MHTLLNVYSPFEFVVVLAISLPVSFSINFTVIPAKRVSPESYWLLVSFTFPLALSTQAKPEIDIGVSPAFVSQTFMSAPELSEI